MVFISKESNIKENPFLKKFYFKKLFIKFNFIIILINFKKKKLSLEKMFINIKIGSTIN